MGVSGSGYPEIADMQEKGRAVEPLIASLREEETGIMIGVRRYFAEALGELADPRGRGPLRAALEDGDETAREAAARALEKLEEKGAASD